MGVHLLPILAFALATKLFETWLSSFLAPYITDPSLAGEIIDSAVRLYITDSALSDAIYNWLSHFRVPYITNSVLSGAIYETQLFYEPYITDSALSGAICDWISPVRAPYMCLSPVRAPYKTDVNLLCRESEEVKTDYITWTRFQFRSRNKSNINKYRKYPTPLADNLLFASVQKIIDFNSIGFVNSYIKRIGTFQT